jgi:hypothetical protein
VIAKDKEPAAINLLQDDTIFLEDLRPEQLEAFRAREAENYPDRKRPAGFGKISDAW